MTKETKRFAIFGNEYQAKKSASIRKVLTVLAHHGAEVSIDLPFLEFLKAEHIDIEGARPFSGDDFDADFVISMGGDGTFLKAAARVGDKNLPIIGINMGRLGFLSDIMASEIEQAFSAIYAGDYKIEEHTVIEVETTLTGDLPTSFTPPKGGRGVFALNDIAVLKRDTASMISIRTSVDKEYVVTYQADGLIVSTPTGSTAYGLSNGGPIVVPNTDVLCLTPVAPHSLNIRPIVVGGNSEISLSVESRSHNFLLAIDGRSETLPEGTKVTIRKAPYRIKIVKLPDKHYYTTLREKMMWGVDSRK